MEIAHIQVELKGTRSEKFDEIRKRTTGNKALFTQGNGKDTRRYAKAG